MKRKRRKANLERDLQFETLLSQKHSVSSKGDVTYVGYLNQLYKELKRKGKDPEKSSMFSAAKRLHREDIVRTSASTYGKIAGEMGLNPVMHNEIVKHIPGRLKQARNQQFKESAPRSTHPEVERWREDSKTRRNRKEKQ